MCLLLCINIIRKKNKEIKLHKELINDLLNNFDNQKIVKLIKYCKEYITYTIDSKEVNKSNKIKDNQKKYSILLESLESQAITNQFKEEPKTIKEEPKATNKVANNITSTFAEENKPDTESTAPDTAKSNKKEKKAKCGQV